MFLMRAILAIVSAAAIAAACGSTGSSTGNDGGDPCAGLGCESSPGALVVRVLNAVGSPVASPTFTENGQPLRAFCETDGGQIVFDASVCDSWHVQASAIGPHVVTVSAPGYEPQPFSATIQGPAGCCGQGPEVDETVTLVAPHGDAGDAAASDGGAD
jgi:hypothetical protein